VLLLSPAIGLALSRRSGFTAYLLPLVFMSRLIGSIQPYVLPPVARRASSQRRKSSSVNTTPVPVMVSETSESSSPWVAVRIWLTGRLLLAMLAAPRAAVRASREAAVRASREMRERFMMITVSDSGEEPRERGAKPVPSAPPPIKSS